jgi:hypothetical protein
MRETSLNRRALLRRAVATAAAVPIMAVASRAQAAQNAALRGALKYQDQPNKGQQCSACVHWVPGPTPTARGGCKIIPGDNEIAPQGWCTAWVANPAVK